MEFRTQPPKDLSEIHALNEYKRVQQKRLDYLEAVVNHSVRHGREPEKFLVRFDHFIRMFNEEFELKGSKRMSRRTLQFYSSPEARLMPYPVRKARQPSHYTFPDHFERLSVIWTLREKFFFPISLVRTILSHVHPDSYQTIIHWDESPAELLDTLYHLEAGFEFDDIDNHRASKVALEGMEDDFLASFEIADSELKKRALERLEKQHEALKEWISSGKGIKFWRKVAEAQHEHPDWRERIARLGKKEAPAAA